MTRSASCRRRTRDSASALLPGPLHYRGLFAAARTLMPPGTDPWPLPAAAGQCTRHGETKVAMLAVSWDTIRLFLHILAATVWVGGQITLAALVPVLRRLGTEIPRAAARRFNQVAWPAF